MSLYVRLYVIESRRRSEQTKKGGERVKKKTRTYTKRIPIMLYYYRRTKCYYNNVRDRRPVVFIKRLSKMFI